jgi:hypothetical protein
VENKIPARIIQTGRTSPLPLRAAASAANLKCLNPDFEYRFFDDAAVDGFIREEFSQYRDIFEGFPFRIQKYDFFRYLAVFRLGGFYFDTDVFFAHGLRELLAHDCVFPFEELTLSDYLRSQYQMDWEIGNYGFGAAAGHPFLGAVIENCVRAQRDRDWVQPMMRGVPRLFRSEFEVLNTTGPGIVTRTLAENPELARSVKVIFPDDVCDAGTWHQFGKLGVHAMEGSWRTKGNYFVRRLANVWESRTRLRNLAESRRRGKTRSLPLRPDVVPARAASPTPLSASIGERAR